MPRVRTDALVVHCSATKANQPFNAASIRQMHLARGWKDIGYHYVILLDGTVEKGRRPESSVGSHVAGFNNTTLGICYVGGLDASTGKPRDTRTPAQIIAMTALLKSLLTRYPKAVILGHRDLSPDKDNDGVVEANEWLKACPCFDAGQWAKNAGLPGGKYVRGKYVKL